MYLICIALKIAIIIIVREISKNLIYLNVINDEYFYYEICILDFEINI